ncbi:unnamed protein product [Rotaria magnacalcarata]|uniref:Uncharacterized protein n=1 Tax=Rotaria magnacalcarata TaxID=392030 RepID=A0A816MMN6_9BILA|nr:unnamed protein product [Rotaria magnacalcarata]
MYDERLVHDYILGDDDCDYNYSFDFNPNSVQSDEIIVEQEDEPLYTGAPVTFKSYHKQILEFGNSVKLSDSSMNTLLQLIGNALPIENKLLRNSSVKSDANSLLDEICDTIKQTVIVDNTNFVVNVLLFKADLSARALATKHVNHNAYYACLECD